MTSKEIFNELKLYDDYIVHECYETDKIIYVMVSKEKEPAQITTGGEVQSYAKWKDEKNWFKPHFPTDINVYKEIHNSENSASTLV